MEVKKMVDITLKKEKKMYRYSDRVIKRRVGLQIPKKYKNKKEVVTYWTSEGGNFVSYKKNRIQIFLTNLRWKLKWHLFWRW